MNTHAIAAVATAAAQDAEKNQQRRPPGRPRKGEARPLNPRREHIEEIDLHLGRTIRGARHLRGMSRFVLARKMGVGPQALEKWERGETRITAGKLWAISSLLDMPITFFFEGFGPDGVTDDARSLLLATLASVSAESLEVAEKISRLSKRKREALIEQIEWLVRQQHEEASAGPADTTPPGPVGTGL